MASDRLTITLSGPPGCGKTMLADWLRENVPVSLRAPFSATRVDLRNIDIVDGENAPAAAPRGHINDPI